MSLPSIAIIDFSSRSDREVQDTLRAVNRQIVEDFMPVLFGRQLLPQVPRASLDLMGLTLGQAAGESRSKERWSVRSAA